MAETARASTCTPVVVAEKNVRDRGAVKVWRAGEAFGFTSHMFVNADGAPDAYKPDGEGLSFTCDGLVAFEDGACVFPGPSNPDWQSKCNDAYSRAIDSDWEGEHVCVFGFEMSGGRRVGNSTVGGRPLVQGADDPAPGNYVSATTMRIPGAPAGTQRRYVNSRKIPFFVLSGQLRALMSATIGDVASVGVAYRPQTESTVHAVIADQGPSWQMGEGSIALHEALGNDPMIVRNGVARAKRNITDDVVYLVFPQTTIEGDTDASVFRSRVDNAAGNAFVNWGGRERLKQCVENVP